MQENEIEFPEHIDILRIYQFSEKLSEKMFAMQLCAEKNLHARLWLIICCGFILYNFFTRLFSHNLIYRDLKEIKLNHFEKYENQLRWQFLGSHIKFVISRTKFFKKHILVDKI